MTMSQVEVPFGDKPDETAILLLAAADDLDLGPSVVLTGEGIFVVPEEVNDKAFGAAKAPAKKTAAKKTAAKKKE